MQDMNGNLAAWCGKSHYRCLPLECLKLVLMKLPVGIPFLYLLNHACLIFEKKGKTYPLHTPPLWVNIFHDVLKSKLTSKIKPSNLQIHKGTHFTQLYIASNFPCLTDVTRVSGRDWVPTRPYSPYYTKLAKQQTVWNTL